ncbi:MAG TPA: DinB family protein [Terriglobales bacterium]|nr:DinB family protein [Terriglobales bacterium]
MSEIPRWMEHKFTFDFPVELYPNILIRLRGTPARLEQLTHGLKREALVSKPDGKWSIQENAGHLLDLEALWLARVREFLAGAQVLSAADVSNAKTHQAHHNDRVLSDIVIAFRSAREILVGRLDVLGRDDFLRVAHHPRLNVPMRLVDHVYFIAEHDDHHLARMWEIQRAQQVIARVAM